jgi:hypothetical protein
MGRGSILTAQVRLTAISPKSVKHPYGTRKGTWLESVPPGVTTWTELRLYRTNSHRYPGSASALGPAPSVQ